MVLCNTRVRRGVRSTDARCRNSRYRLRGLHVTFLLSKQHCSLLALHSYSMGFFEETQMFNERGLKIAVDTKT